MRNYILLFFTLFFFNYYTHAQSKDTTVRKYLVYKNIHNSKRGIISSEGKRLMVRKKSSYRKKGELKILNDSTIILYHPLTVSKNADERADTILIKDIARIRKQSLLKVVSGTLIIFLGIKSFQEGQLANDPFVDLFFNKRWHCISCYRLNYNLSRQDFPA